MGEVVAAVDAGWSDAVSSAQGYVPAFQTVGTDMVGGMVAGVQAGQGALVSAVTQIVQAALAAAEAAAGTASPSKYTKQIFKDFVAGGTIALQEDGDDWAEAAAANTAAAVDAVEGTVSAGAAAVAGQVDRMGNAIAAGATMAEVWLAELNAAGVQVQGGANTINALISGVGGNPNQVVGFAAGGFTGHGTGIAGPVHREEFVFDPVSTRNIGVENLAALQAAGQQGSVNSTMGGGDFVFAPSVSVSVQGGVASDLNLIRRVVKQELATAARDAESRWRSR